LRATDEDQNETRSYSWRLHFDNTCRGPTGPQAKR
jgi:hypothetical protein